MDARVVPRAMWTRQVGHGDRAPSRRPSAVRWIGGEEEASLALRYLQRVGEESFIHVDRSPDMLRSYLTEGDVTLPMIAEDSEGIRAYAAVSIRRCYLNGDKTPFTVGYLSGLHKESSSPQILRDGYRLISQLPTADRPKALVTSIMNTNSRALETIGSGRRIFGALYRPLGGYSTFLFKPRQALHSLERHGTLSSSLTAASFTDDNVWDSNENLEALARRWNGHRCATRINSWLAHGIERATVVISKGDNIRAFGALLNVDTVRRWRVNPRYLSVTRRCVMYALGAFGKKPSINKLHPTIFLDSLIFDPDDVEAQRSLLFELCAEAARRYGADATLCVGVLEGNPLIKLLAPIKKHTLHSTLFTVDIPELETISIDDRPWHVDVASL